MRKFPWSGMRAASRRKVFGLAVCVVSLLVIFGHQCLLLGVAHAAPPAEKTSDHGHGDDHRADLKGCEILAVNVSLPTEASPVTVTVVPHLVIPVAAPFAVPEGSPSPHVSRTPLFLLHTSLLI